MSGEHYNACNITQHDRFDGGSVMVWGGKSMEWRTNSTLEIGTQVIKYQVENPISHLLSD